jgi:hypothetical protein
MVAAARTVSRRVWPIPDTPMIERSTAARSRISAAVRSAYRELPPKLANSSRTGARLPRYPSSMWFQRFCARYAPRSSLTPADRSRLFGTTTELSIVATTMVTYGTRRCAACAGTVRFSAVISRVSSATSVSPGVFAPPTNGPAASLMPTHWPSSMWTRTAWSLPSTGNRTRSATVYAGRVQCACQ